ncbi:MAG TPA: fibronectin type III domain-containing protein [Candidatus Paceibacterota bacterium]|nr:fibronectin type III domain-containing protein [Candidatus Paceibacterota bacterium]
MKISLLRWLICTAMLMALPALQAAAVTLTWSPSIDPTVVGYKVYYGVVSGDYTNSIDVGNVTNVVVTNLAPDTTYYFAATSYDILGVESVFSNEIAVTTPLATNSPPSTNSPAVIASPTPQNVSVSGQFSFDVSGDSNEVYVVQASADLIIWVPVQTNAPPFTFVDTNAGQFASRFYRVVNVPGN